VLDLAAIDARANAATPGPWTAGRVLRESAGHPGLTFSVECCVFPPLGEAGPVAVTTEAEYANAAFIAHARDDVPALTARVRALEAALLRTLNAGRAVADAFPQCVACWKPWTRVHEGQRYCDEHAPAASTEAPHAAGLRLLGEDVPELPRAVEVSAPAEPATDPAWILAKVEEEAQRGSLPPGGASGGGVAADRRRAREQWYATLVARVRELVAALPACEFRPVGPDLKTYTGGPCGQPATNGMYNDAYCDAHAPDGYPDCRWAYALRMVLDSFGRAPPGVEDSR